MFLFETRLNVQQSVGRHRKEGMHHLTLLLLAFLLLPSTTVSASETLGGSAQPPVATVEEAASEGSSKGSIFGWTVSGNVKLYDVLKAKGIPASALDAAFKGYDKLSSKIINKNYMTFVNSSATLNENGFTVVDLKTGAIEQMPNSHGVGSDVNGKAVNFSDATDRPGSNKTSLGLYLTNGREFQGSFGPSLRVQGYSPTNHNALYRGILVHGYDDVGPGYNRDACLAHQIAKGLKHPEWCTANGRLDQGCFALEQSKAHDVISKIQGASLLYAYSNAQ